MVAQIVRRVEDGGELVIGQRHRVVALFGQHQVLAHGQPVGALVAGVAIVQLESGSRNKYIYI